MDWFGDYDDFGIYLSGLGDHDETGTGGGGGPELEDPGDASEPGLGGLADAALAPAEHDGNIGGGHSNDEDEDDAATGGRGLNPKSAQEAQREAEARRAFAGARIAAERAGKQAVVQLLTPR
jgi:hypothetical protein